MQPHVRPSPVNVRCCTELWTDSRLSQHLASNGDASHDCGHLLLSQANVQCECSEEQVAQSVCGQNTGSCGLAICPVNLNTHSRLHSR